MKQNSRIFNQCCEHKEYTRNNPRGYCCKSYRKECKIVEEVIRLYELNNDALEN